MCFFFSQKNSPKKMDVSRVFVFSRKDGSFSCFSQTPPHFEIVCFISVFILGIACSIILFVPSNFVMFIVGVCLCVVLVSVRFKSCKMCVNVFAKSVFRNSSKRWGVLCFVHLWVDYYILVGFVVVVVGDLFVVFWDVFANCDEVFVEIFSEWVCLWVLLFLKSLFVDFQLWVIIFLFGINVFNVSDSKLQLTVGLCSVCVSGVFVS